MADKSKEDIDKDVTEEVDDEDEDQDSQLEEEEDYEEDEVIDSQATADSSEGEEGEATGKPVLPDKIKQFPKLKKHKNTCCDDSDDDYVLQDNVVPDVPSDDVQEAEPESPSKSETKVKTRKSKSKKKEDGLFAKRAMAFFMLLPMLAGGLAMLSEVVGPLLGKYEVPNSLLYTAAFGVGGIIIFYGSVNIPGFANMVKVAAIFSPLALLLPTYQVYSCSPIPLKNDMLGTWFSLKTDANKFLSQSHITSHCFQNVRVQAPYMLSLITPKITLTVDMDNIVSLDVPKNEMEVSYLMFLSKRSVKRKFHKIYLLVQASGQAASIVERRNQLSAREKIDNLLVVTGSVIDLPEDMDSLKKEVEAKGHNVRPLIFQVTKAEYKSRYHHFTGDDTLA